MYVLIVYDVDVDRVSKVNKMLREYLNWIQNSVFEGELTNSELMKIKKKLKSIISEDTDSVLIFKFRDEYSFEKIIIGQEKNPVSNLV